MAAYAIRKDEQAALILALIAHALLFAWLAWQPPAEAPPVPERMTVTLSDELGPLSTSPEPQADPAPDRAPVLAETQAEPEPVVEPEPKPAAKPLTKAPAPKLPPKSSPKTPPKKGGATNLDDIFGPGATGGQGKQETKIPPATAPSAQQQSSWSSSIGAKVRGPWNACAVSGLDADKLVVTVRFTLDRFGEVATLEEPVVSGITDGNRPQVNRFKECAVRAIRTAAPFDALPREYYDFWKSRRLNFRKQ